MRVWDILNRTGNRQRGTGTEDGGRKTEDGRRRTEDGGRWSVVGGRWARGKSSFWSALFVAQLPPGPPSSSGAAWHRADGPTHRWKAAGCKMPFRVAAKGAWPSLQGITTNMALLTELSPCPFHGAPAFGCGFAAPRLRIESGRQRAGSKRIRPVLRAGPLCQARM